MTIGYNPRTKETTITLSPEESVLFKRKQRIRKLSGDSKGAFYVDIKLTRPRNTPAWFEVARKKYSDSMLHTGHY